MGIKCKYLLLVVCLLFLTGCDINYDVYFNKKNIEEVIEGYISNEYVTSEYYDEFGEEADESMTYHILHSDINAIDGDDTSKYNSVINENGDSTYFKYTYNYTYDNFSNSTILKECFNSVTTRTKNGIVYLHAEGPFMCDIMDESSYKVVLHSPFSIDCNGKSSGKTCTYEINSKNASDFSIDAFVYLRGKKGLFTFWDYIVIPLLIIGVGGFIIIKRKINLNND